MRCVIATLQGGLRYSSLPGLIWLHILHPIFQKQLLQSSSDKLNQHRVESCTACRYTLAKLTAALANRRSLPANGCICLRVYKRQHLIAHQHPCLRLVDMHIHPSHES